MLVYAYTPPACLCQQMANTQFQETFFPPEMWWLLSIFCLQAQQESFHLPSIIITWSQTSWCRVRDEHIHTNTGWCPRSHVHLLAFSQSILEHASTAMPEIIFANSTADEIRLPKKSFDFSNLRARKKDPIIWLKLTVNLKEAVVLYSSKISETHDHY